MGFFDKYMDQSYKRIDQHFDLQDGETFVDLSTMQPVMGRSCDVWANGIVIIKTPGYSGEMKFPSGYIKIANGKDIDGHWLFYYPNNII